MNTNTKKHKDETSVIHTLIRGLWVFSANAVLILRTVNL